MRSIGNKLIKHSVNIPDHEVVCGRSQEATGPVDLIHGPITPRTHFPGGKEPQKDGVTPCPQTNAHLSGMAGPFEARCDHRKPFIII